MRSPRRSRGSLAAAGSRRFLLVLALIAGACSSSPSASGSPTPSATAVASPSPTVSSVNGETPVPQRVLPPAPDLPVANLCSAPIATTADGNATPLLCASGAVNVQAWQFYASVSASILGLGLNPTRPQPDAGPGRERDVRRHRPQPRHQAGGGERLQARGHLLRLELRHRPIEGHLPLSSAGRR